MLRRRRVGLGAPVDDAGVGVPELIVGRGAGERADAAAGGVGEDVRGALLGVGPITVVGQAVGCPHGGEGVRRGGAAVRGRVVARLVLDTAIIDAIGGGERKRGDTLAVRPPAAAVEDSQSDDDEDDSAPSSGTPRDHGDVVSPAPARSHRGC
jgi:hypothetical protein